MDHIRRSQAEDRTADHGPAPFLVTRNRLSGGCCWGDLSGLQRNGSSAALLVHLRSQEGGSRAACTPSWILSWCGSLRAASWDSRRAGGRSAPDLGSRAPMRGSNQTAMAGVIARRGVFAERGQHGGHPPAVGADHNAPRTAGSQPPGSKVHPTCVGLQKASQRPQDGGARAARPAGMGQRGRIRAPRPPSARPGADT